MVWPALNLTGLPWVRWSGQAGLQSPDTPLLICFMTTVELQVQPVAGRIGAEVVDLKLSHALVDATSYVIRQSLVQY